MKIMEEMLECFIKTECFISIPKLVTIKGNTNSGRLNLSGVKGSVVNKASDSHD